MDFPSKYEPTQLEDKWYQSWIDQGLFKAHVDPNKEPYTIVIPPPNVTGVLHMGHMLNNTIQDILIRKARMEGKMACWVPGIDHASIATEAKVVKMLREKGIRKSDLSREDFLDHAWAWKEKYGGIILEQLKKLGASCDWDRTTFTMDDHYYRAVIRVFVDLHRKGYIYRSLRMVNWDVEAQTAVSNEEVIYNEDGETATLYSVKYQIKDSGDHIIIATVRPETILGDVAIAVNPKDERYQHLIGKKALVPFIDREIPIIADDYVETDFGTGCLKVTPAHDPNDYEIGQRHNLDTIDTIDYDGKINDKCGIEKYVGKDRFQVRKEIVRDLEEAGLLIDKKDFVTRIGRSERTNSVIEPKLSLQWFLRMKELSKTAHQVVGTGEIQLLPNKFINTYNHWMENVRDWCISRQLWWGHRIPVYYYGPGENEYVVAESLEEAVKLAREQTGNPEFSAKDLKQDEDVLDTWASSWLFPLQTFHAFDDPYYDQEKGKVRIEKNEELDYFYPTQTLVTAPEILFFWVARMIIAGYEYTDRKPFENVYLTGIVRDKQRRKMSKSLGNSPDPLDLIKKYGADGVRTGMLFSSPAGNDLLFDEKLCEQGRNFSNKIWNAFRLIKGWEAEEKDADEVNRLAVTWMENKLNYALESLEKDFAQFRISDALMTIYKLVWNDFCSWYLEIIKPPYQEKIDAATQNATLGFAEQILKLIHPFMPFISEELWWLLRKREDGQYLMISSWPAKKPYDAKILSAAEEAFEVITAIRNLRAKQQLSPKEKVQIMAKQDATSDWEKFLPVVKKMANLESLEINKNEPDNFVSTVVRQTEFCLAINADEAENSKEELEEELDYSRGFLASVEKKLGNEKFVNNAPDKVVDMERKKKADAEARIKILEESLAKLQG